MVATCQLRTGVARPAWRGRVLACAAGLLLLRGPLAADMRTAATQEAVTSVVIRVDANYPPFSYRDDQGRLVGYTVDVITSVLDAMGIPHTIEAGIWSEVVRDFSERKRLDVVAQMSYSDARTNMVSFSPAICEMSFDLLTRADRHFTSLNDIRGCEVIVLRGGIMEEFLRQSRLTDRILLAPDDPAMLSWLASGRGDAALTQKMPGLFIAARLGLRNIRPSHIEILPRTEHLVVARHNEALLNRINEGLKIIAGNDQLRKIRDKWFGGYERQRRWQTIRPYMLAVAALGLLASVFLGWSWMLRRKVAQQTRRSLLAETRMRDFLEALPSGVVEMDIDGRVVFANGTFVRMTGYSLVAVTNMRVWEFLEPGPERDAFVVYLRERAAGVSPPETLRANGRHKDGHRVNIEIDWSYKRDVQARVVGFVAVVTDVTAQHALEERLRQSEKLEALGRLAGGIAHDLNNQLGGIVGFADMLLEGGSEEGQRLCIEGILKGADNAAGLVRRLLTFARKHPVQRLPFDLHAVLNDVAEILRHSIDRRIRIVLRLDAPAATLLGDAAQWQNAFLNLGLNARDAMPEGGTLLFATAVVNTPPGGAIRIDVSDTGHGIPLADQPFVFDPFFTTRMNNNQKAGLGLATVYGTVRQHDGTITLRSSSGAGTTFTITLPLGPQTAETTPAGSLLPTPTAAGEPCVLVIDDEEIVRQVLTGLLNTLGYRVLLAADGLEAVARLREHGNDIALAILDMIMPHQGGCETFDALRAIRPDLRIVIASGHSLNDDAQKLLNAGASGFLQKPFSRDALARTVHQALALRPPDATPPADDPQSYPAPQ